MTGKAEENETPSPPCEGTELRQRAESRIQSAKIPEDSLEGKKFFHELQVHQAELEIQNEELLAAKLEVETLLENYANLYDFAPIPYVTLGSEGQIRQSNHAAASFLGAGNAVVNQSLHSFISEASLPEFERFLSQVFASGIKQTCELELRSHERRVWVVLHGRAEPDRQSCLVAVLDISDRKQAEQVLQETDRRKNEFLAILAHELRNPLTPISFGLKTLRLSPDNPELSARMFKLMDEQIQHLVILIDSLLDISRISFDKIELHKTRMEIAEAVRLAVETSQPLIAEAGHEFQCQVPAEPIWVEGDLNRLSQVFANLLNNAVKFTPPGGHISLTVYRLGQEVQISIRDDGIGICKEMIDGLFDIFVQGDPSPGKAQGGLGIGLNLVKRLTEMHGGTVKVESEGTGKGSEFRIRLPLLEIAPQAQTDHVPASVSGGSIPANRRILVADDNANVLTSVKFWLESLGYEVMTAVDGLKAVEAAERFRPDLMLLDIGMPGLDGYEVCRRIRKTPWGSSIVIVALTGWGRKQDLKQSEAAGFNQHLVKPVDIEQLELLLLGMG